MTHGADPVAAVAAIVERGGDADDVLREVLAALHEHGCLYAAIRFLESGERVDGPAVGAAVDAPVTPVVYEGAQVGELLLATDDPRLAERVAELIAPYVLVGWDTSGERWEP